MKVSVITAAKNSEGTIADTLRSVQAQDYSAIEHVVIDGCSTDRTLDVVRSLGHRVARFVSERDSGIYEAFNRGLRLSSGDVIAFLNSDDIYESCGAVSAVVKEFERRKVDVIYGDVVIVRSEDIGNVVRYYSSRSFAVPRLRRGFIPAHPAMFVRRAVYERFGEFNASYRIAGDFEWIARVFSRGGIESCHLAKVLVRMRSGGASSSGLRSTIAITREIRRACREQGIDTSYLRLISRFPEKALEYFRRPELEWR